MSDDLKENNTPLVSVIIPCYNVEAHVLQALNSVLDQDYSNWEIICVDDGSSDDTLKKIMHWRASQNDIKFRLSQQENKGACAARNAGIQEADGTYFQFLDADDILLPGKLSHQVGLMESHPKVSFLAGAYTKINVQGKRSEVKVPDVNFASVFFGHAGITSANLFKAENVKLVGGWNEQLPSSQEADLMFRVLLESGKGLADHEHLTEIHEREEGQISKSDPVKRLRSYLDVRTAMIDSLSEKRPEYWEKNKRKFYSFIVSTLLLINRHESEVWRDYSRYIPFKSELVPIAGLSKKNIRLIRLMGYTNYFKLTAKMKPKKI